MTTTSFFYRNHRGVIEERTIDVDSIEWINNPGYNYQPGWFISGRCHDRDARRSFALVNIVLPEDIAKVTRGTPFKLVKLP